MQDSGALAGQIIGLFTGSVQTLWPGRPPSAIAKLPVEGPVEITFRGLAGDEQADPVAHGGPDQAIHHYSACNHTFWKDVFPESSDRFTPGCFGENVCTDGLDEWSLCIGDVLSLGSALVQVCQARQPCWKLNARIGIEQIAYAFRRSGRTGWYYRVLEEGRAEVGDYMNVIERPAPNWSVHRVAMAYFSAKLDRETARALSAVAPLSREWRGKFSEQLENER